MWSKHFERVQKISINLNEVQNYYKWKEFEEKNVFKIFEHGQNFFEHVQNFSTHPKFFEHVQKFLDRADGQGITQRNLAVHNLSCLFTKSLRNTVQNSSFENKHETVPSEKKTKTIEDFELEQNYVCETSFYHFYLKPTRFAGTCLPTINLTHAPVTYECTDGHIDKQT